MATSSYSLGHQLGEIADPAQLQLLDDSVAAPEDAAVSATLIP